ncbi:MAG: 3-phosphoshikimate 1-carboxyvinyltransferase, partial [Proteobacteria bacterium]|nr:3-phosphoshikimate 1-carboxyvinyltransferase [Pseudomonadota bacterium]
RGVTVMRSINELRIKESDRIAAIVTQLGALGAHLWEEGDDLFIEGPTPLKPQGSYDSYGDHRIAMTLAVAGLVCGQTLEVADAACAGVSYPDFYRDLEALTQ